MLLFVLLLVLSASASTDIMNVLSHLGSMDHPSCPEEHRRLAQCVEPHLEFIEMVEPTLSEYSLYNAALMNNALLLAQNVSECLGQNMECEGPRIVSYTLNHAIYIGTKIYGDAFHCFINVDIIRTFSECGKSLGKLPKPERMINDVSLYHNIASRLTECIAQQMYSTPSCTLDRIVDLYQAAQAFIDASYQYIKLEKEYPADWEYLGDKYC